MHTENHAELLKGSSGGSLSSQLAELRELEIMSLQLGSAHLVPTLNQMHIYQTGHVIVCMPTVLQAKSNQPSTEAFQYHTQGYAYWKSSVLGLEGQACETSEQ